MGMAQSPKRTMHDLSDMFLVAHTDRAHKLHTCCLDTRSHGCMQELLDHRMLKPAPGPAEAATAAAGAGVGLTKQQLRALLQHVATARAQGQDLEGLSEALFSQLSQSGEVPDLGPLLACAGVDEDRLGTCLCQLSAPTC